MDGRTLAALRVSFGLSLLAAAVNAVFGFIVAWVLVRYEFPGRRALDAIVDLPFALPTAVAGHRADRALCEEWLGRPAHRTAWAEDRLHAEGIFIALVFIGLPFIVRTIQPVLEDMSKEAEEAAATGATRRQTFLRVVLPASTGSADRLCAGAGTRCRRAWLGHLHCRQHPLRIGNRAAPDRDPPDRIQLSRGDRDRHDHAGDLVRAPAVHKPAPGLEPPETRA